MECGQARSGPVLSILSALASSGSCSQTWRVQLVSVSASRSAGSLHPAEFSAALVAASVAGLLVADSAEEPEMLVVLETEMLVVLELVELALCELLLVFAGLEPEVQRWPPRR